MEAPKSKKTKIYYGGYEIVPSPILSIRKEFIYANDAIIGYSYVIDLSGYASSFNHKHSNTVSDLPNTVFAISDIHSILHRHSASLIVQCVDGTLLIEAQGGQLRSFNAEESENKWNNYAPYNATLEFSNVYFPGYNSEIDADSTTGNYLANYMVSLKSFSDSWQFNMSDEEIHAYYTRLAENGVPNEEDYTRFNVTYTITANGKHYYNSNNITLSAVEAAKNFVQKKLYDQILAFRDRGNQIFFNISRYDSNDIQNTLASLNNSHIPEMSPFGGVLNPNILDQYKIFNETINCSSSTSEGSFTATYNCVLKKVSPVFANMQFPQNSIHSFDVTYDQTRDFTSFNRTISVNGTLQGLLETNILGGNSDGIPFHLPYSGPFLQTYGVETSSKYTNAYDDFKRYISNINEDDLNDVFKTALSINFMTLFPGSDIQDVINCLPEQGTVPLYAILAKPQSFNVDHNYSDGSISYTAEYSTDRSCAMERGFETLTITEVDAVPLYAEFTVPGRNQGPIIQSLNTNNHRTITFDFEGVTQKGCVKGTPFASGFVGDDVCDTNSYTNIPIVVEQIIARTEFFAGCRLIPRSENINYNPIDGSYKLSKSYTICPPHQE